MEVPHTMVTIRTLSSPLLQLHSQGLSPDSRTPGLGTNAGERRAASAKDLERSLGLFVNKRERDGPLPLVIYTWRSLSIHFVWIFLQEIELTWGNMSHILQPMQLPVISNDSSLAVTLNDISFTLQYLMQSVDITFDRIGNRLKDEGRRVELVNERISICQRKVSMVRGSKKATTVFSTAKFPAPKHLSHFPTLFSQAVQMVRIFLFCPSF